METSNELNFHLVILGTIISKMSQEIYYLYTHFKIKTGPHMAFMNVCFLQRVGLVMFGLLAGLKFASLEAHLGGVGAFKSTPFFFSLSLSLWGELNYC